MKLKIAVKIGLLLLGLTLAIAVYIIENQSFWQKDTFGQMGPIEKQWLLWQITNAESTWEKYNFENYDIDARLDNVWCRSEYHIQVRQGIATATEISEISCFLTIDDPDEFVPPGIFKWIRQRVESPQRCEERVSLTFDPKYGYPTVIESKAVACFDADKWFGFSNFNPIVP